MPIDACIDLSHNQAAVDFDLLKAAGIAVIHKATEGTGFVDHTYAGRAAEAKAAGALFGAYHFAHGGNVSGQVSQFLDVAGDTPLLALDWEPNNNGATMNRGEAESFVAAVHARTGSWPLVYGSSSLLNSWMHGADSNTPLANCKLWIARYGAEPDVPPAWPDGWTLWQHTDAGHVAGVGSKVDRNYFYGTPEQLAELFGGATATRLVLGFGNPIVYHPVPSAVLSDGVFSVDSKQVASLLGVDGSALHGGTAPIRTVLSALGLGVTAVDQSKMPFAMYVFVG